MTEEQIAFVDKIWLGDGCWNWAGSIDKLGYGTFYFKREKRVQAHRYSWEMFNGPIPESKTHRKLNVCHHCDNPKCVRPDHLFIGDDAANARDKVNKGRHPVGTQTYNSKLTDAAVRKIRSSNEFATVLAKKYNVCPSLIRGVKRGLRWAHVK